MKPKANIFLVPRNMNSCCLFCNNIPLTKEHVLPQWLRNHYSEVSVINEFTSNHKQWITQPFDLTAKVVCKNCNEGWMSDLEDDFRPIFNEMLALRDLMIDEPKQSIIALWVQKTVLMLNQATPSSIKITSETYKEIYNDRKATKRIVVYLGWRMKYGQDKKDPLASFSIKQINSIDVIKTIYESVKKQVDEGGFAWKATLAVGPLVFELIGHNMNVILDINGNTKVMQVIRPYNNDIKWPLEWPIEAEGGLESLHLR